MTNGGYTKFRNDDGVLEIRIGVKEFNCIGASPPHDHPHIYLYIGDDQPTRCPYCATVFRFDPSLRPDEAEPPDCLFLSDAGERKDST